MQPKSTPMMRAFAACVRANVNVHIEGMPGEAKTAKIGAYARKWGYYFEALVGSTRDKSDYQGLMFEDDGTTGYLTPGFAARANKAKKALIMLDEFRCNDEQVEKASLRLLQERYAGDTRLGDHVCLVAVSNPVDVATDGRDYSAPAANRFIFLDWHFDADEWLDGVLDDFASQAVYGLDEMLNDGSISHKARAKGLVTAYLKANPAHLNQGPPKDEVAAGGAWPSPRSWTNLMDALGELRPDDQAAMLLLIKGAVGEGVATEFFRWLSTADLHNPQDVIDDPSIVDWSGERADRLFVLTNGIASLVMMKRDDKSTWEKAARALTVCASHNKADVALPAMRKLLNNMPQGAAIPRDAQAAFSDLFQRTGQWAAA